MARSEIIGGIESKLKQNAEINESCRVADGARARPGVNSQV
jgi:hypothetical protein